MAMAGQPREYTTTTEAWQEEPLNLGSLGMILAMLLSGEEGLFGQKKPEGLFPSPGGEFPTMPGAGGPQFTEQVPTALTPMQGQGLSPWDLLNLLTQGGFQGTQEPATPFIGG